jgi:hypothetical protein
MAKTYIKELQETIESLNDSLDLKEAERYLLLSELETVNEPCKLLGEQTGYLLDMLQEVVDYEKKYPSERIKASKERLIALLDINTRLGKIVSYNANLQASNRNLYRELVSVMAKNKLLEKENKKLVQVDEFGK